MKYEGTEFWMHEPLNLMTIGTIGDFVLTYQQIYRA